MPVNIIHLLEVVNINNQERNDGMKPSGSLQFIFEDFCKESSVVEIGKRVGV